MWFPQTSLHSPPPPRPAPPPPVRDPRRKSLLYGATYLMPRAGIEPTRTPHRHWLQAGKSDTSDVPWTTRPPRVKILTPTCLPLSTWGSYRLSDSSWPPGWPSCKLQIVDCYYATLTSAETNVSAIITVKGVRKNMTCTPSISLPLVIYHFYYHNLNACNKWVFQICGINWYWLDLTWLDVYIAGCYAFMYEHIHEY
jgi:hypothetical protein